mmetsp:Transcript_30279/g.58333  ORF Transcript_30279/g.58333 Transcript_30279/m.58333 type:complete len:271 (-) Transcript_30279:283-1095(-)
MTSRILHAAKRLASAETVGSEAPNNDMALEDTRTAPKGSESGPASQGDQKASLPSSKEAKTTSAKRKKTAEEMLLAKTCQGLPFGQCNTFIMHMYRAETQKLATYRTRLDRPTQWALTVLALLISILFDSKDPTTITGTVPLLVIVFLVFCNLEARRFRIFLATHYRTRLLETGFYAEFIGLEHDENWVHKLHSSLWDEGFPISQSSAFNNRWYRSYNALSIICLIAWVIKIESSDEVDWEDQAPWFAITGVIVVGLAISSYFLRGEQIY